MTLKELAQWITEKPKREISFRFFEAGRAVEVKIREGDWYSLSAVSMREIEFGNGDILGLNIADGIRRIEQAVESSVKQPQNSNNPIPEQPNS